MRLRLSTYSPKGHGAPSIVPRDIRARGDRLVVIGQSEVRMSRHKGHLAGNKGRFGRYIRDRLYSRIGLFKLAKKHPHVSGLDGEGQIAGVALCGDLEALVSRCKIALQLGEHAFEESDFCKIGR